MCKFNSICIDEQTEREREREREREAVGDSKCVHMYIYIYTQVMCVYTFRSMHVCLSKPKGTLSREPAVYGKNH